MNEMNSEKTYEFFGVDAKTEWRLGLIFGIILLVLVVFLAICLMPLFEKVMSFLLALSLGLGCGLFILNLLGKKHRKLWRVKMMDDKCQIWYGNKEHLFLWNDIIQMSIEGNVGFRYFTIKTQTQAVKIRVGTSPLTPFSQKRDLEVLDTCINTLKSFLNEYFTRKVITSPFSSKKATKITYTRNK